MTLKGKPNNEWNRDVAALLKAMTTNINKRQRKVLLDDVDLVMMFWCKENKERLNKYQLSLLVGLAYANVMPRLKRLKELGFIKMELQTKGKKQVLVSLTENGKHILNYFDPKLIKGVENTS